MTRTPVIPPLESVLGSAQFVVADRIAGEGPPGALPLTPEMLRNRPSGDVFGLTQNVGMGWGAAQLQGPEYLIVSTLGGRESRATRVFGLIPITMHLSRPDGDAPGPAGPTTRCR